MNKQNNTNDDKRKSSYGMFNLMLEVGLTEYNNNNNNNSQQEPATEIIKSSHQEPTMEIIKSSQSCAHVDFVDGLLFPDVFLFPCGIGDNCLMVCCSHVELEITV